MGRRQKRPEVLLEGASRKEESESDTRVCGGDRIDRKWRYDDGERTKETGGDA